LDEDGLGACGGEFGGEVGELGQDFVHDADLRSDVVRVDVFCEEAANVACWEGVKCQWEVVVSGCPCVSGGVEKTALGVCDQLHT
jgi:hypothetical protein